MKNLIKTSSLVIATILMITTTSFAGGTKEKAIEKAVDAVENGAPDDWMLLAEQADYLIKKDAGMTKAKTWIEASLAIKEAPYNLEVMGDYYSKCNLKREAMMHYIKSMNALKADDATVDTSHIQDKIVALR
ncbi:MULTISPECIES: hypothetical protein [Reichenbachiella]|uniref:Tetratricopeptide repeat-containing protein n=1 Tax=Reichenbachiella agariperforans TaxID=156994 RepID=A0A1M6M5J2_REIAG|nr:MULTISPECIES: hypothetical protein [Reichenbachiella]MBU2914500.1 hypothetical protein [Reichenbachiella agariperforans]SHJ78745.1 hypothetical protein SAMN04488028_1011236 [Reichenbachiella agariperforans]